MNGREIAAANDAWNPQGGRVVSASRDGTEKVWDVATGQCLATHLHLPEGQHATEASGKIISTTPEAWRWLAWQLPGPRLLPYEALEPFGAA